MFAPELLDSCLTGQRHLIDATTFQPASLTIKTGDSVVWINKDLIPHTATSQAGRFDPGAIAAGASWKQTFKSSGISNTSAPFIQQ